MDAQKWRFSKCFNERAKEINPNNADTTITASTLARCSNCRPGAANSEFIEREPHGHAIQQRVISAARPMGRRNTL